MIGNFNYESFLTVFYPTATAGSQWLSARGATEEKSIG